MKIEIEKSEYDRLKSREEKLMAYYEWFVDKENDLVTVEDIVNKNIELEEENKKLKDRVEELEKERSRDGLLGQATMEEAYNRIYELEEENKKLKSDLSECECSLGFENDEVGFWKREYNRLKKWIKDHCKGYGNLFPEDEMKRQRKKADKKRK